MKNNRKIVFLILIPLVIFTFSCDPEKSQKDQEEMLAEKWFDLSFTPEEKKQIKGNLEENLEYYQEIHKHTLKNSVIPAIEFNPIPSGYTNKNIQHKIRWKTDKNISLPKDKNELAFYPVSQLAYFIKTRQVTSTELTQIYLDRLKKYGDTLQCVVTLTEELALQQAAKADEEIAHGKYRGLLHGIPYGAKDLLAVKGYKTTWGANSYKDQVIDETATVIERLEEAGAVLVAKLTLGALAMGDVWFGGKTRNPWNLEDGSSGSSAGSSSATSAGLVAFSIGTETWGSIVSPSNRCGVTGLRPTYGRVSRHGAMALSWTMDKIGPICRSAEDCAIVLDAIYGPDGKDPMVFDYPFNYDPNADIKSFRIGYFANLFDSDPKDYPNKKQDSLTLNTFHKAGIQLEAINFPEDLPIEALSIILSAEAAAAFDDLTRSNRDSLLVSQDDYSWPNIFRSSRFIPAVEYIQANRIRKLWVDKFYMLTKDFDAIITPSFQGDQLLLTNLTGNPSITLPNGFNEKGSPVSFGILGNLFEEGKIIAIAKMFQEVTDFDEKHPPMFK